MVSVQPSSLDARAAVGPDAGASPHVHSTRTLLSSWRERVTTTLLWTMVVLGAGLLLAFVPLLLQAHATSILAFSVVLLVSDVFMAWRRDLPLGLRTSWASMNLVLAAVPELFVGGDRGAIVGLTLGAIFTATLLRGWRSGAVILGVYSVLIAVTAWGYEVDALPLHDVAHVDWNSTMGWAGLWSVLVFVSGLTMGTTTLMFRELKASLDAQQLAAGERERNLRELVEERAQRDALRVRMDEAMQVRASVERALHDTLSAVNAGFWENDLRTGDVTWSDGLYPLLGIEPGTVAPTNDAFRALVVPEDYDAMMAVPLQPRFAVEYRIVRPDGSRRWLRSQMQAVFDDAGAPLRLRGIVTDITDERTTALQMVRLAEVANRTANAVVVTDLSGRIEWVNEAFTRITGWPAAEVIGRSPGSFLQGPHTDPDTLEIMRAAVRACEPFDVEVLNYTRTGEQYWVHIETRVARDQAGQPTGFVALETDITERRVADSRESLAQRIAALLLTSRNVHEAGARVMQELVTELDVRVAQMWLVKPGEPHLSWLVGASSTSSGENGLAFVDATRALPFACGTERVVGVGVPGVAWGTKRSCILQEFSSATSDGLLSRRLLTAQAAGFSTFCATPILGPDGVLGVIEIGGTAFYPGHELLPSILERVAEQLASFMMHDVSRRAFESVFAHSPDGLLLVDADGFLLDGNARAIELFGPVAGRAVDDLLDGGHALVVDALAPDTQRAHPSTSKLIHAAARGVHGAFSAELGIAVAPSSTRRVAIVSVRDLTERHAMEAALTRSLREKDTLLREVHHRVKNNLQIVSSLLTLQSESMDAGDARDALTETVFRVRSMSYVHQQLYGNENLDEVDLADYARTLATTLQSSLDPRARVAFDLQPVAVSIDLAVPCGLILNELITNALKHGRAPDGTCHIDVRLAREGDGFVLVVADRGPGMPAQPNTSGSLGTQLTRSLSRQLRARTTIDNDGGCRITMTVPSTRAA